MKSRIFEASFSNLDKIMAYLREYFKQTEISLKRSKQFEVALEEAIVNIMKYAYNHPSGIIEIECNTNMELNVLTVKIQDSGTPFNPLEKGDIQSPVDLESQPIGGLGIYFIKKMSDTVDYKFINNNNILILSKKITALEK